MMEEARKGGKQVCRLLGERMNDLEVALA